MRRLKTADGVHLALHDLGGARGATPLLFVHGTGFCGQVFAPLAVQLGRAFRCWAVDMRGHGLSPLPDGASLDWDVLAQDVLAVVDRFDELRGCMAVGHSAGGAAVLLAEARRPGTFGALWTYEPIMWPDPDGGRERADWLAEGAGRRRDRFASRDEAYANFSSKRPLNVLAPAVLRAYVEHGFADAGDGSGEVVLRCHPAVEAAIYRGGVARGRFEQLAKVECPVVVACGGRSDAIGPAVARPIAEALPAGRLSVFEGLAHFGPLEDPARAARAILADLSP